MQHIKQYFTDLSPLQTEQLSFLGPFYSEWNEKINLISRKDINNIYIHHILHSLSIAKLIQFKPFTNILDIGTGGGFPGIPLAILFPKTEFHLIDARQKKIMVVNLLIQALNLQNVKAEHIRAEEIKERNLYDFVVSRAVTNLSDLYKWSKPLIATEEHYNDLKNGLLILKGGAVKEEAKQIKKKINLYSIQKYFKLPYFEEKFIVHL